MFASRFHFAEFSISGEALVNQLVVDVVLTPHHRRQLQKLCLILFMKWRTISGKSRSLSRAIGGKLKNEQQSNVIKLNISLHQLILLQTCTHRPGTRRDRPPKRVESLRQVKIKIIVILGHHRWVNCERRTCALCIGGIDAVPDAHPSVP